MKPSSGVCVLPGFYDETFEKFYKGLNAGEDHQKRDIIMMSDWIPFEDAMYLVNQAFLVGEDNTAALLEKTSIEVYTGRDSKKHLKGSGLVQNMLLVELLEENDNLDLLLDLGENFKYLMKKPNITAGKVFSPNIKSYIQFDPVVPWEPVSEPEFTKMTAGFTLL